MSGIAWGMYCTDCDNAPCAGKFPTLASMCACFTACCAAGMSGAVTSSTVSGSYLDCGSSCSIIFVERVLLFLIGAFFLLGWLALQKAITAMTPHTRARKKNSPHQGISPLLPLSACSHVAVPFVPFVPDAGIMEGVCTTGGLVHPVPFANVLTAPSLGAAVPGASVPEGVVFAAAVLGAAVPGAIWASDPGASAAPTLGPTGSSPSGQVCGPATAPICVCRVAVSPSAQHAPGPMDLDMSPCWLHVQ
mmetsp:Transcript_34048/g.97934  ORF Transcript_34048/g.97934 Transcript_34048/m.97934 type:complete len:248 (-) Transcript_34048:309-1052(-)